MAKIETLELVDIIDRTLSKVPKDAAPLIKYLKLDKQLEDPMYSNNRNKAKEITHELRMAGGHDIANLFRSEGPKYDEIVYDVGKKIKAEVSESQSVFNNEEAILKKLFADVLDQMTDDEKRELLSSMDIAEADIPLGASGTIITQIILRTGGFGTYQVAVIVANFVARAILGHGLTLAANAAITRALAVVIGPIGWIATGLWLLYDISGPAYRKTVPCVVHIAMLRLMLKNRVTLGVVGDGSAGKDSLIKGVFGLDTGGVDPVAGSTREAKVYKLGDSGAVTLVNYPGFNDIDKSKNEATKDFLGHTDVFLLVVDISRGVTQTDVDIYNDLNENFVSKGRQLLVCCNKVDLPRTKTEKDKLVSTVKGRFKLLPSMFIETTFDPDPRLKYKGPTGCDQVYKWVCNRLKAEGKKTTHIPKGDFYKPIN